MIKVNLHNTFSKIVDGYVPQEALDFFTIRYKTKRRRRGQPHPEDVEKQIRLYSSYNQTFPSGLIYQFDTYLKDHFETGLIIKDCRRIASHCHIIKSHFEFELFPYQKGAFQAAIKCGRGIIVCPTGSGKTLIAQQIVQHLGQKTLFLVHTLDLLDQAYKSFSKCFPDESIGVIGNKKFNPQFITIATVQTLWRRFKNPAVENYLKTINVLIADEVHHVSMALSKAKGSEQPREKYPGNSLYSVMQATDAYYRIGLSAKIARQQRLRRWFLEATIGRPIYTTTYNQLRDDKVLADGMVFIVKTPLIKSRPKSYFTAYNKGVQLNAWVHNFASDIAIALSKKGKSVIMMVDRLTRSEVVNYNQVKTRSGRLKNVPVYGTVEGHAGILHKVLEQKAPGKSVLLTGKVNSKQRATAIDDLRSKRVKIAVGTLLKEGVDIPTLDAILFLCGGRAEVDSSDASDSTKAIQAVGRALRNPNGKENQKQAVHIDIYYDDGGGMLSRHSRERIEAYEEHGYSVKIVKSKELLRELYDWFKIK